MKTTIKLAPAAALVAAACAGPAFATDLPKEGNYDVDACLTRNITRIDYSETHYAYSYEETGTLRSNPPGGMFDDDALHCVGMTASFNGKRSGGVVCEWVAKDGDKRLTRAYYDSDGKMVREAVIGTGKYDGIIMRGTVESKGAAPQIRTGTDQNCNRMIGTYKLK
jgi:hypothetical protein